MYLLVLKKQKGLTENAGKAEILEVRVTCDPTDFAINQIIPIVITERGIRYKISEARVIRKDFVTATFEIHVIPNGKYHPIFGVEEVPGKPVLIRATDRRQIPHYMDYETLDMINVGSHYRR